MLRASLKSKIIAGGRLSRQLSVGVLEHALPGHVEGFIGRDEGEAKVGREEALGTLQGVCDKGENEGAGLGRAAEIAGQKSGGGRGGGRGGGEGEGAGGAGLVVDGDVGGWEGECDRFNLDEFWTARGADPADVESTEIGREEGGEG